MKITLAVVAVLLVATLAMACPKGTTEWEGGCAALPSPDESTLAPAIGVVSDEKPPRHPEPAYQRGDVKVDMPQSMAVQDIKLDQEKAQADAQGKKSAGIK